jgi:hypothetical protein
MANIADLSGDEREQRAAELKRKMQEAARRTKAAQEASAPAAAPAPPAAAPAAVAVVEAPAEVATATVGTEVVEPMADDSAESVVVTSEAPVAQNGNGVAAAPAPTAVISAPPRPVAPVAEPVVEDPEAAAKAQMNRREFLTYAWGAALGLLTLQGGVASFLFLYPRFRAGEFGGDFFKPMSEFGDPAAEPNGDTTGKFWMVTTAEGEPKAIYMVFTSGSGPTTVLNVPATVPNLATTVSILKGRHPAHLIILMSPLKAIRWLSTLVARPTAPQPPSHRRGLHRCSR